MFCSVQVGSVLLLPILLYLCEGVSPSSTRVFPHGTLVYVVTISHPVVTLWLSCRYTCVLLCSPVVSLVCTLFLSLCLSLCTCGCILLLLLYLSVCPSCDTLFTISVTISHPVVTLLYSCVLFFVTLCVYSELSICVLSVVFTVVLSFVH